MLSIRRFLSGTIITSVVGSSIIIGDVVDEGLNVLDGLTFEDSDNLLDDIDLVI